MSSFSDPRYWKHFASAGIWSQVDATDERSIPAGDRAIVRWLLEAIVPKATYRDGLERQEAHLLSPEINETHEPDPERRKELKYAANQLDVLNVLLSDEDKDFDGLSGDPVADAISSAVGVLKENGIAYSGWRKTYLWQRPSTGQWQSLSPRNAAVIMRVRDATPTRDKKAWREKYPWRRHKPLWQLWSVDGAFRAKALTPFWHALRILSLENDLRAAERDLGLKQRAAISTRSAKQAFDVAAKIGVQIGLSHQSINKKAAEYDAVEKRRRDIISGDKGRLGGAARTRRKQAAYAYLDGKASAEPDFHRLSPMERITMAMKWADLHDTRQKTPADRLFQHRASSCPAIGLRTGMLAVAISSEMKSI